MLGWRIPGCSLPVQQAKPIWSIIGGAYSVRPANHNRVSKVTPKASHAYGVLNKFGAVYLG